MTLGAGMNWPVNRVSSPHSCFRHDISCPITLRSISYYVTLQYRPRTLPTPTDQQSKSIICTHALYFWTDGATIESKSCTLALAFWRDGSPNTEHEMHLNTILSTKSATMLSETKRTQHIFVVTMIFESPS